jgi:replication factor A2
MFGSSQNFGQDAATPVKAKKQEEKTTVLPLTVRMLESAVESRTDESADVLIHGSEAGMVHLVGVVEGLVQQTAMVEFQLNDASGRVKVRQYFTGDSAGKGIDGLTSGRYVSVIGNLRTSPAVHVSAMNVRAVTSADEISYHMIEVALATLRLRAPAGGVSTGGLGLSVGVTADPGTPSPMKIAENANKISPMKVDAPVPVALDMQPAASDDIRGCVLKVLEQGKESAGDQGVGLASVIAKLAHCKASQVKEILQGLVDEGEIFTTIDDEHYALI